MGNLYTREVMIDLHQWSSPEFHTELAVIYSSPIDNSRFSIFRLSSSQDRVLCRLADFLCDNHPLRLHMEVTAEKDHNGYFKFGSVRVVVEGIPAEFISLRHEGDFNFLGGRGCYCGGPRSAEIFGSARKMVWEFFHWYGVRFRKITHHTFIECDKVIGLSAKLMGPVRLEEVIYGEPPKAMNDVVEREFEGREYILFQNEGKGKNSRSRTETSGQATRVIVNSGGHFKGHGNGSTYNHCNIVMQ